MKVKIVPDSEVFGDKTPGEIQEHKEEVELASDMGLIKQGDPSTFKDVKEVIIPQSVADALTADGLTIEEIESMFTKMARKEN